MGWDAVPEVVMVMLSVRAYVPPRTAMVSPGLARSTARWTLRSGWASVPGALSFPFVATIRVVGAADASGTDNARTAPASAAARITVFTRMDSPASLRLLCRGAVVAGSGKVAGSRVAL
ncbi:hypothetical protein TUSST3_63180 [Streptomyces sp. TUS-ST3]|nr:hypothetical protein TUSST3_63180 [Streptomyces sp. TUS-ST3]